MFIAMFLNLCKAFSVSASASILPDTLNSWLCFYSSTVLILQFLLCILALMIGNGFQSLDSKSIKNKYTEGEICI